MNRVWSSLTLLVSGLLDPLERELALGDVAELGFAERRAFAGMLGLVVRRQLQPWRRSRAWFVLFALVLPFATVLAFASNNLSAQLFPKLILWSHYHGSYATGVASSAEALGFALEVAAIVLGSWSCDFAVAALSRGTGVLDGLLFCVTLLVAMSVPVTRFSLLFFPRAWWGLLPVVMAVVFILAPAFFGLKRGAAGLTIGMRGLVSFVVGTGTIAVLTAWVQGWGAVAMENWSRAGSPLSLVQLFKSDMAWGTAGRYWFCIFLMMSPGAYLLINQILQRNGRPVHRTNG